jgi:hypothetical protein
VIYARRALQRRLNEVRDTLRPEIVDSLVRRLNQPGAPRMVAMWETVVLHALAKEGNLESEAPLPSGRRPDIRFESDQLSFIADIATVSDDSLDDRNPYDELRELIQRAKKKLGLPLGGLDLQVHAKHEQTPRGPLTILKLPPRAQLQTFVQEQIVPRLREQMEAGEYPLKVAINEGDAGLDITIDPTQRYGSGRFAAYDVPKMKSRNPLFAALKDKANQLRAAEGITGVILTDGDCVALSKRSPNWDEVSAKQIVSEFFRQFTSVDFVLLLSVRTNQYAEAPGRRRDFRNDAVLLVRDECEKGAALNNLFEKMSGHFPKPAMMPANGALRAREPKYDLGHHGGHTMGGNMIRISLREFTEILAGLRTLDDNGAKFVDAARAHPKEPNPVKAAIVRNLRKGRLPASIKIVKTDENDNDDWVEITFGEPDPAISPLR